MPFVYSAQMFLRYLRVWIFPFLFGGFLNRIIPWWFRPEQNNLYGIFFDKSETSNRLQEQIVLATYKIKRCSSWCLFSLVTSHEKLSAMASVILTKSVNLYRMSQGLGWTESLFWIEVRTNPVEPSSFLGSSEERASLCSWTYVCVKDHYCSQGSLVDSADDDPKYI